MPGNIEASKRGPTPAAEPQHRSNPVKSLGQWVAYVRLLITVKIFSYISNEEFYQWAEDRLATLGRRSLGQWDAKAFEAFRLARLEKMGGFEKGFLLKWELEKNEKNEFTGRMILLPKPKLVRDKTIDSRLDEISAYEKAHGVTVKLEKDWYSVVEGRWQWLQALRHKLMEETHELGDDLSNQEAFFTQAANLVQAMQRLRDFTQGTSAAAPETARSSVRTISGSVWRYFSREERIRRKLLRALKRVNFFEREIGKMSLPDNFPLTHDDIRAAAQRFYTFVQEASIDFSNPFFEAIASVDPVGRYLQIHPELVKNLVVHMSIWFHEAIHLSERHEAVLRYSLSLRKKLDTVPLDSLKDKGFSEMAAEYLQIIWQMENESAYAQIAFLNARAGAERLSLKDYMKDLSEFIDFRLLGLVYLDILGRAFEKEMQQAKAYRPDKITSEFEDLRLSALMSDDSRPLLAALARADGLEVPQDIQEFYDQFFEDSGFRDFITAWARKKILSFKAPSAQFAAAPEQKRDGFGVLEVIVWATALTGLIIGVYLLAHPGILHHAISVLHQGWSVLATVSAVAAKKSLVPILTGAIFFLMAHAGTAAAMQPAEIAEPEDSLEELPVNPLTKLLAARSLGKWQINENILRAFRVLPDDPKAVGWLLRWADNNDAAFNQIARCAVCR